MSPQIEHEVVSHDPFTGEEVFRTPVAGRHETAAAVTRAHAGADAWALTAVELRAQALRQFADRLETDAGRLAELIVHEVGKRRVDAEAEVAWTALSARWYAEHPPAQELAGGARVIPRPLGVIAAVTPWNVPLVTPAWKWLPALMAGNTVIWKPSELATGVAAAAHEHLMPRGFPPTSSSCCQVTPRPPKPCAPTSASPAYTSPAPSGPAGLSPS